MQSDDLLLKSRSAATVAAEPLLFMTVTEDDQPIPIPVDTSFWSVIRCVLHGVSDVAAYGMM
jgi:hypothetical protein